MLPSIRRRRASFCAISSSNSYPKVPKEQASRSEHPKHQKWPCGAFKLHNEGGLGQEKRLLRGKLGGVVKATGTQHSMTPGGGGWALFPGPNPPPHFLTPSPTIPPLWGTPTHSPSPKPPEKSKTPEECSGQPGARRVWVGQRRTPALRKGVSGPNPATRFNPPPPGMGSHRGQIK